ncbi:MAG: ThiF family adenylyltransferase, partial [Spirochaetales bacterium]|nr:ThiF family adenylyltransferase [Spirochaetales bacterium]
MDKLKDYLLSRTKDNLLPWSVQQRASNLFDMTYAEVEENALQMGILPVRYKRNRQTISTEQQLCLFRSRVAVIGCGGLGGYIIEGLVRLGVGCILAADPDVFEEHNLNRQILCSIDVIGRPKVEVAVERAAKINPAVDVIPITDKVTGENRELLKGINAVVDALDSIDGRLKLAGLCRELEIPFIHGSIAGWYGQIATQFPGDDTIEKIFARFTKGTGV